MVGSGSDDGEGVEGERGSDDGRCVWGWRAMMGEVGIESVIWGGVWEREKMGRSEWKERFIILLLVLQVLDMIENNNYRLEQPRGCPTAIYKIMRSCWSLEPANRPNFFDLHRAFTNDSEYRDISAHRDLYQNPGDIMG